MKTLNYLGLLLLGLAGACHSASDQHQETQKMNSTAVTDSVKQIDPAKLLIAGKQAGAIYLGQDMNDVFKLLGKADDGDAAMGSALGVWYTKEGKDTLKKDPVIIFSSYRDSNMVVKDVKQVSVAASSFSTNEGVHTGAKLAALKAAYPALKKSEVYVNDKTRDSLMVYDVIAQGIAFDLQQGICTAITIHPENKAVNGVYLTVHPGWRKLQ